MATILDYVVDIGVSVLKENIKNVQEEKELRCRLREYLNYQDKYNFNCTIEEEIDFQGLAEYICNELLEDVKLRLFGTDVQRGIARQSIMDKASFYAQSKTHISDKRARQMVTDALDIIRAFYRSKVNRDLKYISAEIEDAVIGEMTSQHQILEEEVKAVSKKLDETSLLSIDRNISLIQSGNMNLVEKNLTTFLRGISAVHTLPNDYRFGINERNQLVSIPLSDGALRRYPPHFSISAKAVKMGEVLLTKIDNQTLSQSYRHQIPISFDIVMAKKYLGVIPDPSQAEAEEMMGAHAILYPPEFPKAFPCNVIIDGEVIVDYLLLRTKEILNDGAWIITNDEQENFSFKVTISINPTTHQVAFSVTPINPTNNEQLQYRIFLKKASMAHRIVVKALAENIELVSTGKLNPFDSDRLDDEIEFLKRIVAIEQFWSITLPIPQEITPSDHLLIYRLYSMITEGVYQGKQDRFDFTLEVSELSRESIYNIEPDKLYSLAYIEDVTVSLFNQTISFPLLRRINGARIDNLDEVKKELTDLRDGKTIKLKYISGNEEKKMTYLDAFYNQENEEKLLHAHAF